MVALHVALDALRTELSLVEREVLPRLEADHLLVLHLELDAALLAAEATVGLDDAVGLAHGGPSAGRHVVAVRPVARHELRQRSGQARHQPFPPFGESCGFASHPTPRAR